MVNQQFSRDCKKFKGFKGFFQGWVKFKGVSRVSRFFSHPVVRLIYKVAPLYSFRENREDSSWLFFHAFFMA